MKYSYRLLLCLSAICFIPLQAVAIAPVVDDSENFAIFDEQQAATVQPVAKERSKTGYREEEIPLARDTIEARNMDSGELLNKLQGLQQDIQELRGQLEVQAHDLKRLQEQQLAFYKDMDARLGHSGKNSAALTPQPAPQNINVPVPTQPAPAMPASLEAPSNNPQLTSFRGNPADEQISYLAAYELVKNKRFDEALAAMQTFIQQYPQGGYTANAQYWLGELYMVKNNYPKAISHFETVLKQFPSSSKAAASTLKIGYALAASGKEGDARMRLQQVLKNYPDTPTAQLATIKLESLGVS
ncbi:MAG: tol-pal system protein YbgF [Tatlockia sp.]